MYLADFTIYYHGWQLSVGNLEHKLWMKMQTWNNSLHFVRSGCESYADLDSAVFSGCLLAPTYFINIY